MKNLNKKIFLILFLLTTSSCGFANLHYTVGYNLAKGFSPHPHKVNREGKDSFPSNDKGIVNLNLVVDGSGGKESIDTLWRKINDDDTFSERISLTYLTVFKNGRLESMIEPGTYFLDGLRYIHNNKSVQVGAFLWLMETNKQKGWDVENKKPLWFSFKVEKGQEVYIPDILVSSRCLSGSNSCDGANLEISMKISESDSKKLKNYQIGYQVKKVD